MRSLLLLFSTFALSCVVQQPAQDPAAPAAGEAQAAGSGSCEGVCQHYLGCKGLSDDASYQQCLGECGAAGVTPDQMAQYQTTDCAQAIQIYESYGQDQAQAQGQGQGGQPATADCNGCAWDGSQCIWVSQSNWGQGPYSGAASSCDPSCCGR